MAAPVINRETDVLVCPTGSAFSWVPDLDSGTADSWSVSDGALPAGLSIDGPTGEISGTVTAAVGDVFFTLRAENADPASDEFAMRFRVATAVDVAEPGEVGRLDVEMEMDLETGAVFLIGVDRDSAGAALPGPGNKVDASDALADLVAGSGSTGGLVQVAGDLGKAAGGAASVFGPPVKNPRDDGTGPPKLAVKNGDRFPVVIGFRRGGVLQDLAILALRLGVKEFMPDRRVSFLEPGLVKLGSGTSARYKAVLHVRPEDFRFILSNYANDRDYYTDVFAEFEVEAVDLGISEGDALLDNTAMDAVSLGEGQNGDSGFLFEGLPKEPGVTYNYAVTSKVTISSHPSQNVELNAALEVSWNGSEYVASLSGTLTGQGEDRTEELLERSTHSIVDAVGTDEGVEILVRTRMSSFAEVWRLVAGPGAGWSMNDSTGVFESGGSVEFGLGENEGTNTFTLEDGDDLATIESKIEAVAGGRYEVGGVFADGGALVLVDLMDVEAEPIAVVALHEVAETVNYYAAQDASSHEYVDDGVHEVRIVGGGGGVVGGEGALYRRSSQTFMLRVESDIVENPNG